VRLALIPVFLVVALSPSGAQASNDGVDALNAILFAVTAQLVTSALMDHFALAGANVRPVTALRALGLLIVVAGVAITQLSDRHIGAR